MFLTTCNKRMLKEGCCEHIVIPVYGYVL